MPTLVHITDLHLDSRPDNLAAMLELLGDTPADLFLIGGDNGGEEGLAKTIAAVRERRPEAAVAWVHGNHDLWGRQYTYLWDDGPAVPATYLELGNLEMPGYTVVGTYGHYDYSGAAPDLTHEQYETFTNGRMVWNDRYIQRLGRTNPQIATELAAGFRQRYTAAIERGLPIIVLTHTFPFAPTDPSRRSFVTAYISNQMIGDILVAAPVLPSVLFCGHTHRVARWDDFGFPLVNTGSDYREVRITRWEFAESLP